MKLFHSTTVNVAAAILTGGFRNTVGAYLTLHEWKGVWRSDHQLDENEGAVSSEAMLIVEIDGRLIKKFEWIEDWGKCWLIPADLLDRYAKIYPMPTMAEQIGNLLPDLLSEGFQTPILMTSMASNGSMLSGRFEAHGDDFTFEQLAEHIEEPGFRSPVHLLFVDSCGKAHRATLRSATPIERAGGSPRDPALPSDNSACLSRN